MGKSGSELQQKQQQQHASSSLATLTATPAATQRSSLKNPWRRSEHPLTSSRAHSFSSWTGRGHDLFSDSFVMSDRPKVLLEAIGPSGIDVSNLIKKIDPNEVAPHGALHMMGSILAFPNACFLWNDIEKTSDITIESLAPIILHRPKIEFLFLGTSEPIPQAQLMSLKKELKEQGNIVVEWLPLVCPCLVLLLFYLVPILAKHPCVPLSMLVDRCFSFIK